MSVMEHPGLASFYSFIFLPLAIPSFPPLFYQVLFNSTRMVVAASLLLHLSLSRLFASVVAFNTAFLISFAILAHPHTRILYNSDMLYH